MFIRTDKDYVNLNHVVSIISDNSELDNNAIALCDINGDCHKKCFKDESEKLNFLIYLKQGQFDKLS
jgi:hypothetical protein